MLPALRQKAREETSLYSCRGRRVLRQKRWQVLDESPSRPALARGWRYAKKLTRSAQAVKDYPTRCGRNNTATSAAPDFAKSKRHAPAAVLLLRFCRCRGAAHQVFVIPRHESSTYLTPQPISNRIIKQQMFARSWQPTRQQPRSRAAGQALSIYRPSLIF
jgi:hypothetical protein